MGLLNELNNRVPFQLNREQFQRQGTTALSVAPNVSAVNGSQFEIVMSVDREKVVNYFVDRDKYTYNQ